MSTRERKIHIRKDNHGVFNSKMIILRVKARVAYGQARMKIKGGEINNYLGLLVCSKKKIRFPGMYSPGQVLLAEEAKALFAFNQHSFHCHA